MGVNRRALSCDEVVMLTTDYLEGVLPARLRTAIEHHLAGCPNCTNYVAQLRMVKEASGRLRRDEVPEDLVAVLTRAFEETQR